MSLKVSGNEKRSIFRRKTILLNAQRATRVAVSSKLLPQGEHALELKMRAPDFQDECTVLVINSSHDMAKEITLQLTLSIPGCSIMYAPTIEVAKWILKRRRVNLIVSSPLLADGSIERLKPVLERMEQPADLVVVGTLHGRSAEILSDSAYRCTALRRIRSVEQQPQLAGRSPSLQKIRSLGADIRNDLNNPLQEIVAMVFVARAGTETSATSDVALDAIERAATNMSKLVNALEDKIRNVVAANF